MKRRNRVLKFIATVLSVAGLTAIAAVMTLGNPSFFHPTPAFSQSLVRVEDVEPQVYQQVPDLPRENEYVSRETGKVDPDNTLVRRMIRYHVYVKGRPPGYRLDWKLTLADYLGANSLMQESRYPGYDSLKTNPLEGDRTAIGRLNRAQRDVLAQALANAFSPRTGQTTPTQAPPTNQVPSRVVQPPASSAPSRLLQPKPGDARLLLP